MNKNKQIVDNYERICSLSNIDIISSGRYIYSGFNYVNFLVKDISEKLELKRTDKLIDIGCNVGIYHEMLKDQVGYILGIDAGDKIIGKAKAKNRYPNVDYMRFDILEENWGRIPKRFNKALIYSVVHFFNDLDDVKLLLTRLLKVLDDDFIIFLGEVRDKEMYLDFIKKKRTRKFSLRNIKFFFNKIFSFFYLRTLKEVTSVVPTLFTHEEISKVCDDLGLAVKLVKQDSRHPYYNTSVDYILKRK